MNNHHSKLGILVVVILVAIAGIFAFRAEPTEAPVEVEKIPETSSSSIEVEVVACTMDAKMCPDGTYVGRQGPKCEFAPCPSN